jgi:thiol-disulfide isomerase/thioredoxin
MTALAVGLFLGFGTELVVAGAHSPAPLHANEKNDRSPSRPDVSPRLSMTTLDGEPVTLLPFRGKVTLLDIWATWCPPCVEALPRLQVLHDRYAAKGFTVVGVSLDAGGANTVRPFLARRNLTYSMLLDTDGPDSARQALKIETLPTQVLVDASGNVIRRWTGAANNDEIEAAIINALRKSK